MALFKGKLFAGALFAGALFGAQDAIDVVTPPVYASGGSSGWDVRPIKTSTSARARIRRNNEAMLLLLLR